ncbi:MAG TPA: hypothetical protein VFP50_00165 [Anaeromyxobacteraceae bacterium]|nr:hypothetical protein [Anaeromyxobacteraceae bacterium]
MNRHSMTKRLVASALAAMLVAGPAPAVAQSVITNGSAQPGIVPGFLFEPEVPFASLKSVPTWNELEQLLDDPYQVTTACTDSHGLVPGNDQGFPSYCTNAAFTRRQSFGGVALPPLLVHPLNYNPPTGFEMRLVNPQYPGGAFDARSSCACNPPPNDPVATGIPTCTVPAVVIGGGTLGCTPVPNVITVSPGAARTADAEELIDYNSPFGRDTPVCIASTEAGAAVLCGGDPGEPGYAGFGVLNVAGYSVPAVSGVASAATAISAAARLRDPVTGASIQPRALTGRTGGLSKPSLRVPILGGPAGNLNQNPDYLANSQARLVARAALQGTTPAAAVAPSNENDYVRGGATGSAPKESARRLAMVLGKALFWDMQVGSDGVQSCGSCHAHAGADSRTKNQLNPNHVAITLVPTSTSLEVGDTPLGVAPGLAANYDLKASDFPLHRVNALDVAGDPACVPAVAASVAAGVLENNFPSGFTGTVCDAANIAASVDDVASSMGVHFGQFADIPAIGAFGTPSAVGGVASIVPDLRAPDGVNPVTGAADGSHPNVDPIPAFATAVHPAAEPALLPSHPSFGHEIRRVEPRNTPTLFLAANNFDNFWDGRARHAFNGGSVFGAADPQGHVFVDSVGTLVQTRQIIKFASLASLATGPGLSQFEMSLSGRNWTKIAKKLLQGTGGGGALVGAVTPLANQLVDPTDSFLGPYSNQGGSACAALAAVDRSPGAPAPGKPGLCISYPGLIRNAYQPELWRNTGWHLNGCYTDGLPALHPNQCGTGVIPAASIAVLENGAVVSHNNDPFDGYVLTPAAGAAAAADTNQFSQMEANFALFWGLSIHLWGTVLVPDDTPFDRFLDANPDAFQALGEPGEPGLVGTLPNCTGATQRNCFSELGNFKRDGNLGAGFRGTRAAGTNTPDPLLGMDVFFASNLSAKNPNFRTGRCGECHAVPTLTDNTMPFTHKAQLRDFIAEFVAPGVAATIEPLGRLRVISGFLLQSEMASNGQDALERRIANQSIVPCPADGLAYPGGLEPGTGQGFGVCGGAAASFFDNGVYNLGVRPINDDAGRGGTDAFGWPLSLAALLMKDVAGPAFEPGVAMTVGTFNAANPTGGLWEETPQDQLINPGFGDELVNPQLPDYYAPWANAINVGDAHPEVDEAGGAPGGMLNTLTDTPMMEGFGDTLGPFNPAAVIPEALNDTAWDPLLGLIGNDAPLMGTWPVPNRLGRMGSMKAAQLREVELTGPYFHNGGKLTLRQVVDFYSRGGDFPITNAAHRDFNMVNQRIEVQSNLSEEEEVALVDFLLELTDDRVRHEKAPFDHPELWLPLDGTAPENTFGRDGFQARATPFVPATTRCTDAAGVPIPSATGPCFQQVPAVGAAGGPAIPSFLGLTNTRLVGAAANCGASPTSHYCH